VAKTDPGGLYSANMAGNQRGGITRTGLPGSYVYFTKPSMGNKPVNFVSWLDAARYANWLHNGKPVGAQGVGTTEKGAYDLTVANPGVAAVRSPGAQWFLPTKAEWDQAAYTDPTRSGSWVYPTRSNDRPTGALATNDGGVANPGINVANFENSADWNLLNGNLTTVGGAGPLSSSYWGTYDQGGNITEWVETLSGAKRWIRGGSFKDNAEDMAVNASDDENPTTERDELGFRVAAPMP
jgi:formylglycine-generating enzyme required for sulfatase activity